MSHFKNALGTRVESVEIASAHQRFLVVVLFTPKDTLQRRTKERKSCHSPATCPAERKERNPSPASGLLQLGLNISGSTSTPRAPGSTGMLSQAMSSSAVLVELALIRDAFPRSQTGRAHGNPITVASTGHIFPAASFDAHLRVGRAAAWLTGDTHSEKPEREA